MSDVVRARVSIEPVEVITAENGSTTCSILASEVGRILGGEGDTTVVDFSGGTPQQGYANGSVYYKEVLATGTGTISTETAAAFAFVKNTGRAYSTATALGATVDKSIEITVGATDQVTVGVLPSEASMYFPCNTGTNLDMTQFKFQTVNNFGIQATTATPLAIEFGIFK